MSEIALVEDLRRVARDLGRSTVTIEEYNLHGRFHATTLQRRFRSWSKALTNAGLLPSRSDINIENEALFDNLRQVWIALARQPKYAEVKAPLSKYSSGTYENRFGSRNQALLAFEQWATEDAVAKDLEPEDTLESDIPRGHEGVTLPRVSGRSRSNPREPSERLRFAVLLRDGFSCQSCGRSPLKERDVELHIDHIVPYSKGGSTAKDNLITRCSRCNLGKGAAFEG